jgi:sulfate adenylyltransferase subunit 2
MIIQDVGKLEEKSIFIIREAKLKFKNIAALWSMGKDSTAMLAVARKAFLGKVPFPVIHIDNGLDFPETYAFRKKLTDEWGLDLIVGKTKITPADWGLACCGEPKTVALKEVMKEYGFDALMMGIRRDEHWIRAKERYFSPRNENFRWNYKNQPAELWDDYSSKMDTKGHIRVHPMLDWNEVDVWSYVKKEKVPVVPLYFSRNGYRYRSLGCTHCTVPLKSEAKNIDDIIKELEGTETDERSGRSQDKEKEYVMQKLRALGYM